MSDREILITGAYGYIGSHICKEAHLNGYKVYALDKNISSNRIEPYCEEILHLDIRKASNFDTDDNPVLKKNFDAVIHCAALIKVEESVSHPEMYYETNTTGTLNVLLNTRYKNFIFASTGGAFDPVSPYAKSKIIAEEAVRNICKNYNISRFFNVAGNNGEFGQICDPSHIIHIAAQVAAGKREKMIVFGNDYDTPDGTCIRDYVHVQDLAESLIKSINEPTNSRYECIGSGSGYSNIEVVEAMKRASDTNFSVEFGARRSGDPSIIKMDSMSKFVEIKRSIEDMCRSAYKAELKNGK